jgi:hypothetical protein
MGQPEMSNRAFRRPQILGYATKAEFFGKWQALLEVYTSRELRKEHDKLPAISGLAKKMQQVICYFTGENDVIISCRAVEKQSSAGSALAKADRVLSYRTCARKTRGVACAKLELGFDKRADQPESHRETGQSNFVCSTTNVYR